MTGRAELCTALELAIDELGATRLDVVTVGGIDADADADADAEDEVISCGPLAYEGAEDAELIAIMITLLDGETGVLDVDDGGITLDEDTLDEEAMLLDVICMTDGVLEAINKSRHPRGLGLGRIDLL
ncbi:MAG: hypothetical protein Q9161_004384 [Pseudevernia consocians]